MAFISEPVDNCKERDVILNEELTGYDVSSYVEVHLADVKEEANENGYSLANENESSNIGSAALAKKHSQRVSRDCYKDGSLDAGSLPSPTYQGDDNSAWPSYHQHDNSCIHQQRMESQLQDESFTQEQPGPCSKEKVWTQDKTFFLLNVIRGKFTKKMTNYQRSVAYLETSQVLTEAGYPFTREDVCRKWNNLLIRYRTTRDRMKKSGETCPTWAFYNILDEIVGPSETYQEGRTNERVVLPSATPFYSPLVPNNVRPTTVSAFNPSHVQCTTCRREIPSGGNHITTSIPSPSTPSTANRMPDLPSTGSNGAAKHEEPQAKKRRLIVGANSSMETLKDYIIKSNKHNFRMERYTEKIASSLSSMDTRLHQMETSSEKLASTLLLINTNLSELVKVIKEHR